MHVVIFSLYNIAYGAIVHIFMTTFASVSRLCIHAIFAYICSCVFVCMQSGKNNKQVGQHSIEVALFICLSLKSIHYENTHAKLQYQKHFKLFDIAHSDGDVLRILPKLGAKNR